ncbi:MAG: glutaminyl-peptide cyclotransferase [Bacteroidales bacterium]
MSKTLRSYVINLFIPAFLSWILSCSGKPVSRPELSTLKEKSPAVEAPSYFILVSPEENAGLKLGASFKVSLSPAKAPVSPDSVRVFFDGVYVTTITKLPAEYAVPPALLKKTGRKALKVVAFGKGEAVQTVTRFLVVYSDTPAKRNGFRVIKQYPHDKEAFTQGLVYENGVLYEGTGQEARSSLRKVQLENGQVLNILELGSQFFGEGITIYGDRIYQLTWQSRVGFVYEKSSFRQINKVYYQTEGWGITTIGDKLVMSDGTNMLYFMDPETFTVTSTIEVYDNKNKVMKLNELEYINGEIWANIWMTDLIARIDPSSGKVIAYIDLKGILKDPGTDTTVDVLNGIAWDKAGNRIFVTGKNWPALFQITITE